MSNLIPEGFKEGRYSSFSNHVGPFYYKTDVLDNGDVRGWAGLLLDERHCGVKGRGHGGLLLTILDEAMGMAAAKQLDNKTPTVTVSLQTSFLAGTIEGRFLMAEGRVSRMTKSMAFVEGKAWSGDELVGTANGVWKYLHHLSL